MLQTQRTHNYKPLQQGFHIIGYAVAYISNNPREAMGRVMLVLRGEGELLGTTHIYCRMKCSGNRDIFWIFQCHVTSRHVM